MINLKKKKKYPRACISCTVFSLLEYLLYSSYEDIKKTFYIFEDWMFPDFGDKFENTYRMPAWKSGLFWNSNVVWIRWYFIKWFKLPSFRNVDLFTLDHLSYHAIFIGHHRYSLLEDGPYCHSVMFNDNLLYSLAEEKYFQNLPTLKRKLLFRFRKMVYGPVYFNRWGKNDLCSDMILSTDDHLDYFDKKTIHRISFKGLWNTFSIQKQDFILNVFNMTREDVAMLTSKRIVIFTQALTDYISKEEHVSIWKAIISKYPLSDILLKPHPRDDYEYEKEIEGLMVFRKKIPSQFFEVLNLQFSKAVTAYSSSVFNLNAKEIDWYGTEVNETLLKRLGTQPFIPDGVKVNKCKL